MANSPVTDAMIVPCPFCGDEMERGVADWFGHKDRDGDCPVALDEYPPADLEAWNRRAKEEASPADEVARKLAAEIMVAMRQARFPKEYADEVMDEFEALVLTPMLASAITNKGMR